MITSSDAVAASQQTQSPAAKNETSAAATAASDFESFLSLLTAQLRHQDPLSPLDSTQFVEQLASFSSVEQQIETNKLLKESLGGPSNGGLETAAMWIGKEVEAGSDQFSFNGEPVQFSAPTGAEGKIVIRNSDGEAVYTAELPQGETQFAWNGTNAEGAVVSAGEYKIAVESATEDGDVVSTPLSSIAKVTEARLVDGAMKLLLANGAVVDPSAITAIRDPAA